jgi:HPt (histidine-containing phosphotransfer) domain-containing protein
MIAFSRLPSALAEADTAPTLAPLNSPIDRAHLSRMTLGESELEREVLALFDRQADLLLARMRKAEPAVAAAAAHTLKGSARGIGAWRVANTAEALELAAAGPAGEYKSALAALATAVDDTKVAIVDLLRAN